MLKRKIVTQGLIVCMATGLVVTEARAGFGAPTRWVDEFGYTAGEWRLDEHVRVLADVDGDGRDDVVGFGDLGVMVSISTGKGFRAPAL